MQLLAIEILLMSPAPWVSPVFGLLVVSAAVCHTTSHDAHMIWSGLRVGQTLTLSLNFLQSRSTSAATLDPGAPAITSRRGPWGTHRWRRGNDSLMEDRGGREGHAQPI